MTDYAAKTHEQLVAECRRLHEEAAKRQLEIIALKNRIEGIERFRAHLHKGRTTQ